MADAKVDIRVDIKERGAQQLNASIRQINKNIASLSSLSLNDLGSQFSALLSPAEKFNASVSRSIKRVLAFGAAAFVFRNFVNRMEDAALAAVKFNDTLQKQNIFLKTSKASLAAFGDEQIKLANKLGAPIAELQKGVEVFLQQGKTAKEALDLVTGSILLAQTGEIEVARATEALSAIMEQFGEKAGGVIPVVDKLRGVSDSFAVTVADLAEGIFKAGPAATVAGVSLEELLGIITAVQESTRQGGKVIGNAYKTILANLSNPDAIRALEGIGVATKQTNGDLRSGMAIFKDLAAIFPRLSALQQTNIGVVLAGRLQYTRLLALLTNFDTAVAATAKTFNSQNAALKANEILLNRIGSQFSILQNNLVQLVDSSAKVGGIQSSLVGLLSLFNNLISGTANLSTNFSNMAVKLFDINDETRQTVKSTVDLVKNFALFLAILRPITTEVFKFTGGLINKFFDARASAAQLNQTMIESAKNIKSLSEITAFKGLFAGNKENEEVLTKAVSKFNLALQQLGTTPVKIKAFEQAQKDVDELRGLVKKATDDSNNLSVSLSQKTDVRSKTQEAKNAIIEQKNIIKSQIASLNQEKALNTAILSGNTNIAEKKIEIKSQTDAITQSATNELNKIKEKLGFLNIEIAVRNRLLGLIESGTQAQAKKPAKRTEDEQAAAQQLQLVQKTLSILEQQLGTKINLSKIDKDSSATISKLIQVKRQEHQDELDKLSKRKIGEKFTQKELQTSVQEHLIAIQTLNITEKQLTTQTSIVDMEARAAKLSARKVELQKELNDAQAQQRTRFAELEPKQRKRQVNKQKENAQITFKVVTLQRELAALEEVSLSLGGQLAITKEQQARLTQDATAAQKAQNNLATQLNAKERELLGLKEQVNAESILANNLVQKQLSRGVSDKAIERSAKIFSNIFTTTILIDSSLTGIGEAIKKMNPALADVANGFQAITAVLNKGAFPAIIAGQFGIGMAKARREFELAEIAAGRTAKSMNILQRILTFRGGLGAGVLGFFLAVLPDIITLVQTLGDKFDGNRKKLLEQAKVNAENARKLLQQSKIQVDSLLTTKVQTAELIKIAASQSVVNAETELYKNLHNEINKALDLEVAAMKIQEDSIRNLSDFNPLLGLSASVELINNSFEKFSALSSIVLENSRNINSLEENRVNSLVKLGSILDDANKKVKEQNLSMNDLKKSSDAILDNFIQQNKALKDIKPISDLVLPDITGGGEFTKIFNDIRNVSTEFALVKNNITGLILSLNDFKVEAGKTFDAKDIESFISRLKQFGVSSKNISKAETVLDSFGFKVQDNQRKINFWQQQVNKANDTLDKFTKEVEKDKISFLGLSSIRNLRELENATGDVNKKTSKLNSLIAEGNNIAIQTFKQLQNVVFETITGMSKTISNAEFAKVFEQELTQMGASTITTVDGLNKLAEAITKRLNFDDALKEGTAAFARTTEEWTKHFNNINEEAKTTFSDISKAMQAGLGGPQVLNTLDQVRTKIKATGQVLTTGIAKQVEKLNEVRLKKEEIERRIKEGKETGLKGELETLTVAEQKLVNTIKDLENKQATLNNTYQSQIGHISAANSAIINLFNNLKGQIDFIADIEDSRVNIIKRVNSALRGTEIKTDVFDTDRINRKLKVLGLNTSRTLDDAITSLVALEERQFKLNRTTDSTKLAMEEAIFPIKKRAEAEALLTDKSNLSAKIVADELNVMREKIKEEIELKKKLEEIKFNVFIDELERLDKRISEDADVLSNAQSRLGQALTGVSSAHREYISSLFALGQAVSTLVFEQAKYQVQLELTKINIQRSLGSFRSINEEASAIKSVFDRAISAMRGTIDAEIKIADLRTQFAQESLSLFQRLIDEQRSKAERFFTSSAEDRAKFFLGIQQITSVLQGLKPGQFANFGPQQINAFGNRLMALPDEFRRNLLATLEQLPVGARIAGFDPTEIRNILLGGAAGAAPEIGIPALAELQRKANDFQQIIAENSIQSVLSAQAQVGQAAIAADNAKQALGNSKAELVLAQSAFEQANLQLAISQFMRDILVDSNSQLISQVDKMERNLTISAQSNESINRLAAIANAQTTEQIEIKNNIISTLDVNRNTLAVLQGDILTVLSQISQNTLAIIGNVAFTPEQGRMMGLARGSLSQSEQMSLLNAARREKMMSPPGSRLVVANSSETVLTRRQSQSLLGRRIRPSSRIRNAQEGNLTLTSSGDIAVTNQLLQQLLNTINAKGTLVNQEINIAIDSERKISVTGVGAIKDALEEAFDASMKNVPDKAEVEAIKNTVINVVNRLQNFGMINSIGQ